MSLSAPGIKEGKNSTTETFDPSEAYTCPSSTPITPPPTTNKLRGMSIRSNAVFEVSMEGWSFGKPGINDEEDPAAIIHFSKVIFSELLSPSTKI